MPLYNLTGLPGHNCNAASIEALLTGLVVCSGLSVLACNMKYADCSLACKRPHMHVGQGANNEVLDGVLRHVPAEAAAENKLRESAASVQQGTIHVPARLACACV
jgi:hypothetical protein